MTSDLDDAAIRDLLRAAAETDRTGVPDVTVGLTDLSTRIPARAADHRLRKHALTVLAAAAVTVLLVVPTLVKSAAHRSPPPPATVPATSTSSLGAITVAALSPDTPAVDLYLESASTPIRVFRNLGYGAYASTAMPAGVYTVSIRAAGADPTGRALLATTFTLVAGGSDTVAMVGLHADLGLRVFDDRPAPAPGTAEVRIVQAADRGSSIEVTPAGGRPVALMAPFTTVSGYRPIASGAAAVDVRTGGVAPMAIHIVLRAGDAYSLVVLDGSNGGVTVQVHTDAAPVSGG